MIELHSSPTPNGQKVMIMLEETGLEWKHFDVNIRLGEQFSPDYLKLSPNAKENIQYAKDRYNNESVRLYRVLDNRLRDNRWLAGDEYTIADIATYPWTKGHPDRGVDKAGFPNFMPWFEAMEARPAVQRNNKMAGEIRARMTKAAEGKTPINMFDTKDNAQRLSRATGH